MVQHGLGDFETHAEALQPRREGPAQVGLTALFIFRHIFKAKFEVLGIREEMDKLRSENL